MSEEEIIKNVKRIIEYKVISNYINNNDSRAIQGLLDLYNKYKRLAEANLKDSEEFKNNMCEHRCILKTEYEELKIKYLKLESDRFWSNAVAKCKIKEIKEKADKDNCYQYLIFYEEVCKLLEE